MMVPVNANERDLDARQYLFKQTDEGFDVVKVDVDLLAFTYVLEAVWRGMGSVYQ
jgi:hypothetical protein